MHQLISVSIFVKRLVCGEYIRNMQTVQLLTTTVSINKQADMKLCIHKQKAKGKVAHRCCGCAKHLALFTSHISNFLTVITEPKPGMVDKATLHKCDSVELMKTESPEAHLL